MHIKANHEAQYGGSEDKGFPSSRDKIYQTSKEIPPEAGFEDSSGLTTKQPGKQLLSLEIADQCGVFIFILLMLLTSVFKLIFNV